MNDQSREYKFTLNWKQSAKGSWYVDKMGVKADNKEDLQKCQDEAIEVMNNGRSKIGTGTESLIY